MVASQLCQRLIVQADANVVTTVRFSETRQKLLLDRGQNFTADVDLEQSPWRSCEGYQPYSLLAVPFGQQGLEPADWHQH